MAKNPVGSEEIQFEHDKQFVIKLRKSVKNPRERKQKKMAFLNHARLRNN